MADLFDAVMRIALIEQKLVQSKHLYANGNMIHGYTLKVAEDVRVGDLMNILEEVEDLAVEARRILGDCNG